MISDSNEPLALQHYSPPFSDLFVGLFSMICVCCESPTGMWMEAHSLRPCAMNSECTCEWLHSPVNVVNREHTSDWVGPVAERTREWMSKKTAGKSTWPLRLGVLPGVPFERLLESYLLWMFGRKEYGCQTCTRSGADSTVLQKPYLKQYYWFCLRDGPNVHHATRFRSSFRRTPKAGSKAHLMIFARFCCSVHFAPCRSAQQIAQKSARDDQEEQSCMAHRS